MKLINFLYYILYRAFYQYSVKKEMLPNGVSLLLTLLFSTNILLIICITIKILNIRLSEANSFIHITAFLSVFVFNRFMFKYYFIKKENYIWIINKYDENYKDYFKLIRAVGILYTFLTPMSFYMICVYIANGTFFKKLVELGSYAITGQTLEQNIIGK